MIRTLSKAIIGTSLLLGALQSAQAATPVITNLPPQSAFIGESFCYDIPLTNSGTTGYGPYLRVIHDADLTFNGATFIGSNSATVNVGTFDTVANNNELEDPIIAQTVAGTEGFSFSTVDIPVGSVVTNGPDLTTNVCFTIDSNATPAEAFAIEVTPVYEFGDTATGDNGPIVGTTQSASVEAALYQVTTQSSAAENELAAGPSFSATVTHTVDVANGPTIDNLQFTDVLDNGVQYSAQATITGGTGCAIDSEPSTSSTGGILDVSCASATGTSSANDVRVSYPMHFINVLNAQQCSASSIVHPLDFNASFNGNGLTQVSSSDTVTAKHVAIQQGVNTGESSPGNTLTVTNSIQISDYVSVDSLILNDTIADGVDFSSDITVNYGGSTFNITRPASSTDASQNEAITYNVTNATGTLPGGSVLTVSYTVDIQQNYVGGYTGVDSNAPVVANDSLSFSQSAQYNVASGASSCLEGSSASVSIEGIRTSKFLVDGNGDTTTQLLQYAPGESVTYRLRMDIPSGDTNDIVFVDFLPLPVFLIPETTVDTNSNIASNTSFSYTAENTVTTLTPTITVSSAENSVTLDWGSISTTQAEVLEVDFTVEVTDKPYADGLELANLFQGTSTNTPDAITADLKSAKILVRAPELTVSLATSAGNVDAGDTIQYTLTVTNEGGATSFDTTASVPIVSGVASQSLVSATVDGNGVALGSGSLADGTYSIQNLAAGEVYVLTFTQDIAQTAEPNDVITSEATIDWASAQGQAATFDPQSDDAFVTVSDIAIASTIVSPTGNVVVGDTVQYRVDVTLPEGTTNDLTVDMTLPAGFEYSNTLTVNSTGFDGTVSASPTVTSSGTVASGQTVRAVFNGSTTTNNDNDPSDNTFSITLEALVQDVTQNAATTSTQSKQLQVNAGTNNTTNNASATSTNQFSEHVLSATTSVAPSSGVEAGDTVTVTIDVENTGTATAYDVEVVSNVNTDIFTNVNAGTTPTGFTYALQTSPDRVTYSGTELAAGDSVQFTYTAEVKAGAQTGSSFDITAQATGDSQTGDQAVERDSQSSSTGTTATRAISADNITLIASSETFTSDSGTRESAIGEVLTYAFTTVVPEGQTLETANQDIIEVILPAGMAYQAGTALIRGTFDTGFTTSNGVSITASDTTITPVVSGQSVIFDLGDITNNDNDAGDESITVTLDVLTLNTSNNNRTNNKTVTGEVNYLNESSANQSNSATQNIRIAEPNLTATKTASPSTVDGGSEVTFTVTLTNTSGTAVSRAHDWYINDNVPARFNSVALVSAIHSRGAGIDVSACANISGNELTVESDSCAVSDIDYLAAGESVTVVYTAQVNFDIAFEETVTNTVSTSATSLPGVSGTGDATPGVAGSDNGERTGSGANNDSGQNVNDIADSAMASVTANAPTLTLTTTASDAAIGTVVDLTASFSIPTGTTDNFVYTLDLPSGLTYTGDAITITTPVSDFTSTNTPNTTPGEGTDPVVLDFGTITNSASTSQQVTIAVPVEVANILSNQGGITLTSTGSLSYQDVSSPAPSANVDVDVIEPNLSITQTIIAGATSSDSGDTVTYRTVVTNTGNTATAYAVTFEDVMPAELLGGPDGSGSGVTFSAITLTNPSDEAVLTGTNTALTASDVSETTTTNTGDTLSVAAFDLPALASVTVEYSVVMANEASAGETLTNAVEATYNSQLDGSGRSSADGGDDDNNATLNNYRETASSNVTVDNTLAIQSALNATHSDNDFAVGESVSIDARIDLVEGTIDGVSIVNTLPADIRFDSISINSPAQISYDGAATASVSGNDVTVDFGTVSNTADGNSANDYITVTFTGVVENEVGNAQGTTLTNSVNASGGGESAGPSTLEIDIVEPNLDSTMTLDKTSVSLEDTFTLTINVGHNSSFADAFETTFNVSVPSGLTYVANSFMGQGTIDDTSPTLLVVDMGGITLVDGSKQVTLQFTVDSDADVGNALSIGLTNGAYSSMSGDTADERDYSFADSINVTGDIAAFIGATQSVVLSDDVNGNGFIDAGDTVLVTSTLTNESDSATATDVVFTHGIPANTNYVAGSATTTKGTLDDSAGITVNVGDMAFGESETITFELLVDANVANNTLVSLQGSVDSSDTVAEPTDADGNDVNGDQANTFRVGTPANTADLDITQLVSLSTDADTNDVISPNDTLTITYLLENTGSQALSNIALSDAIPTGLTYVANSATVSGGHTVSVIGSSLSADFITLAAGASETVSLEVTIDSPLVDFNGNAANESFSLQGEATSDETDTVYADNNRADSDGFQPLTFSASTGAGTPELEIIQYFELVDDVDGDGVVDPGDSVRVYTVATNQGSATAENVSFTQPVNAGLSVVANTAVTSQGVVVSETPFDVNVGGVAPSETVTASVVLTLDANAADNTVFSTQALFSGDNLGANQLSDNDSNATDGENALLIPVTSQAQTVSAPTFALTDTSDGGTSGNNFVQGETLTLTQTVTVPKGTTDDLSLSVTLPANVSLLAGAGELARTFNTGLSSGVNPASINSTASGTAVNVNGNISVSNNTLTLDLGSIVNSDNDGDTETYVFSVELDTSALVPSAATQDLTISSALSYVDGAAQPQSLNANDVTVTLLNRVPAANDDSFTVDEDTTSNTLAARSNDSDTDNGQSISITSVATPSNGGTVTTDGANLIYTPAADFFGTETVQYTLTDSAGGSDTATATFTVNNVQDAPVAQADSATTTEDTQVVVNVLANDSDVDGDTLSITAVNSSNGAVSFAGSNITFTPAQDFNGPALVTYTISDGNGNSDSANLTVDVQADNDAPVATNDSANTNEDNDVIIDVLANDSDVDGDALSVTAVSASAGAASVNSNGDVLYTPPADFNGPVTLNYTVSDGNGGTDSASVSVTVNAVNDAPIANPDSGTVNEDSSVIIDVLTNDTDVDGDALSITNAASPNGSVTFSGNNITFTPTADFNGATTVTYTVSDGAGGTASGTVTINVTNVNDAPVASDDTASTNEDTAVVINVLANDTDIDNDALSVSNVSATNGSAIVNGDGNVVFTPAADYNGSATVAYTVTDGNGGSDNASVSVAIAAVNDNPIANPDTASVNEDESVSINVLANDTDVDGDTLSVASASVTTGSVQVVGNQVNYTPEADFNGSATITYTIEDGAGGSASSTVEVTITNVNDAPVVEDLEFTIYEDDSLPVTLAGTDADEDVLTFELVTLPTGEVLGSAPSLLYVTPENYNGTVLFSYKANDGQEDSNTANITVNVVAVNDAPVAVADTASTLDDTAVEIDVLSNDLDVEGDALSILGATADSGSVEVESGVLVYTPALGTQGDVQITYTITDASGATSQASVIVTVSASEQTAQTFPVVEAPADIELDAIGYLTEVVLGNATAVDASGNAIPVTLLNGQTRFAPGLHTVYWQATDDEGNTTTVSQTIRVNPQVSLSDDVVVTEGGAASFDVLLSGNAPSYPVTVSYTVSGTADTSDHDLISGTVTIESGTQATVKFNIIPDTIIDDGETVIVTLNENVNVGEKASQTTTIAEAPVAPVVALSVEQDNTTTLTVGQNDGLVDVLAAISHTNPAADFIYDWSNSAPELTNVSNDDGVFTFDPTSVAPGVYAVTLLVADSENPALVSSRTIYIEVVETLPELTGADTDGDGLPDNIEGTGDADLDGVPNYLDSIALCSVAPEIAGESAQYLVESNAGACVSAGEYTRGTSNAGVLLLADDSVVTSRIPTDTETNNVGGLFNFDVVNNQSNQAQFDVVIPQRNAVPEDAFMRSWTAELGWFDVIADGDAVIYSAPGTPGFCPTVNSGAWQEGLIAGSWCVKLTLTDGGSFDADGTTNGAVSFVGGVGTFVNGNTLPDVQDDQLAIKLNEAVEVDVLANDTDADGDALTLTSVSADFGTATIIDGLVSYTPPEGFVGTVTVTYTVSDGMGGTVTGTLVLTVAENNIPVANDDSFTSQEDESVTLDVLSNDTDEDGDTLSITEVTASTGTVILLPSGELSYQAPANYNGVVTIEYTISDGHGGTDTAQVTLTVTAVNDSPVAVDDTASVTEDGSVTVTVLTNDSDVDGDVLTVTMASTDNGSVVVNNGTTVTYTPVANVNGEATFTYTISDGFSGTDTATVTVVIVAINDAPVANNDQANVSEDSSVIVNALANDADIDGDTLIITDATANSGTVTVNSDGNIVYTPLPNFVGTAIITYTISDGNGGEATAQITVTVENVNDAPTLEGGEVSTNQDTPLSINVLSNANDIDGDTLTIASAEATNGTVEIVNGVVTFTPADGFHGTATITVCVADQSGAQACATYTVTVIDTNDAPVVLNLTFTMEEDATLPIQLQGSDADGDALTYQLVTSPDGELVGRLPNVLYAPDADFSGTTTFTFTANDGEETSNVGTVTINVNPVNDAPVARDDAISLGNYNPAEIDVLANDSDADGDTLRIIGARVELGDVSWSDDSLTYTPLEGFVGEIVIDYTITDPQGEVAQASVLVDVMPDDLADRPVIEVPEDVFVDANALFTKIDLGVASAVDKFGNPLPVSLVDGLIFYEPGNNTAYWQATDEDGLTSVASQAVRVRPLVSITKDQVVLEGHEVEFGIHLNGTSPVYPLEIPFTVSGTADSGDHDLVDGIIVMESGSDKTVSFNVFPDADIEGTETIIIELSDVLNIGNKYIHEITIREDNVNPDVDLFTEQDGESRIRVIPTGSDVLVTSRVDHPDPTNEYEFVWTSLDADLADTDSVDDTFTFDPSGLEIGVYRIRATVTDADDTAFTDSDTLYIQVVDALPSPTELDSDGDGVPDVVDGLADSDRDGILDYLDPTPECNVLPQEVAFVDGYMVEGDPGVCLRLGNFSVSSELGGAKIIDGDIAGDDDIVPDPEATNIGGIFDFIAYGLPEAGQTLNIVMPQLKPIPANAVYRKFTPENGWVTFTENANNRLWSVQGEPGYCPPPGGDYWTEGLTEGHWCVQLEILDGGVDDDDGLVNGTIVDPGGVSVMFNGNTQPVANDDAVTIIVDESVTIEALSNDADPDGDDLRITSATTTFGTAVIAGDTIEYTPPLGFIGEVIVNYGISDGNGGSDLGVITVTIIGNNPPQAVDDTVTIDVDQSVTVNVLANDFDEDGDSIRVVSAQASIGSVSVNPDDTLTFTPPAAFTGNAVVTYIIEDTQGGTSEGRLTITVQPVTVRIENSGGGGGSMNAMLLMLLVFVMTLRRLLAAQRKGVKA
ncbi:tandem-95 repeat protein [Alteromonas sp. CNT1-28]|uniref:Ig-like domain-containing protein n=2 Tax=unclassified Alteromonas TaxID=2614992 RepID=UPI001EF199E5|nr:tandem-95 repeat protein [Alteromonas sp. CNT1-28]MCG7637876.1 tandem-95 repeat protein [Alteromonas sp. CNT1-28]